MVAIPYSVDELKLMSASWFKDRESET